MDSSVILRHISMGTKMLLSHILLEASDEEIASEISVLYLQGYQSLCNSLPNMNGKFVYRLQCYQSLEISSYHFIISIFFSEKNIYSQFISRLLPHRKEHLNSYVIPFIDESYSGGCVCSQPKLGMYCTIFAGKKGKNQHFVAHTSIPTHQFNSYNEVPGVPSGFVTVSSFLSHS